MPFLFAAEAYSTHLLYLGIPSLLPSGKPSWGFTVVRRLRDIFCFVYSVQPFPLNVVLWPLLTSASSAIHYCMACYPQPAGRPPRVRTIAFIPSTRCIYRVESGQYGTSFCLANSSTPLRPYMQFLFIEPGFCLQLLSDSTSRWTPLL